MLASASIEPEDTQKAYVEHVDTLTHKLTLTLPSPFAKGEGTRGMPLSLPALSEVEG